MTTNYTVYSPSLTALDTSPVLRPDTGEGAPGEAKVLGDYVALTTGQLGSTSTKAGVIRIPTQVKLKRLHITTSVQLDGGSGSPALALDVGAYYGDAPSATNASGVPIQDGTVPSNAGVVVNSGVDFANTLSAHAAALLDSDISFADPAKRNKPLWSALGLLSDPGGFFDIVVKVHTAAAGGTITAGNLGIEATYVM